MAAPIVATIGTMVIGSWGLARIEEGIVPTAATAGSLYVENHIAPHLQELASHCGARCEYRPALANLRRPGGAASRTLKPPAGMPSERGNLRIPAGSIALRP